jgi:6-phosphogluconolactonase (cycloisomerase 2 family)
MRASSRARAARLVTAGLLAAAGAIVGVSAGGGTALAAAPAQPLAYVVGTNTAGTIATFGALTASSPATELYQQNIPGEQSTFETQQPAPGGEVAVSPAGDTVYVANPGNDVAIYDPSTGEVKDAIPTDVLGPLALSPSGGTLYVAGQNGIDELNTATDAVSTDVIALPDEAETPFVSALAVSADGSRLYALDVENDNIYVYNTATGALVTTISGVLEPSGIVTSPSGSKLYVTGLENQLYIISTATNTITATDDITPSTDR